MSEYILRGTVCGTHCTEPLSSVLYAYRTSVAPVGRRLPFEGGAIAKATGAQTVDEAMMLIGVLSARICIR